MCVWSTRESSHVPYPVTAFLTTVFVICCFVIEPVSACTSSSKPLTNRPSYLFLSHSLRCLDLCNVKFSSPFFPRKSSNWLADDRTPQEAQNLQLICACARSQFLRLDSKQHLNQFTTVTNNRFLSPGKSLLGELKAQQLEFLFVRVCNTSPHGRPSWKRKPPHFPNEYTHIRFRVRNWEIPKLNTYYSHRWVFRVSD